MNDRRDPTADSNAGWRRWLAGAAMVAAAAMQVVGCGFTLPVRSTNRDGGAGGGGGPGGMMMMDGAGGVGPAATGGSGPGGAGATGGRGTGGQPGAMGSGGGPGAGGGPASGAGGGATSSGGVSGGASGGVSGGASGGADGTCAPLACEGSAGPCKLRVPATFRDFNISHSDFEPGVTGSVAIQGLVQPDLDAEGKPVLSSVRSSSAYIASPASFAEWYRDTPGVNTNIPGEIVLWNDGNGHYVNRWGAAGEPWIGYPGLASYCSSTDCSACLTPPGPGQTCVDPCPFSGFGRVCIVTEMRYDGNPLFFPVDGAPVAASERHLAQVPEQYGWTGWPTEASVATSLGVTTAIPTATAPFPSATHNFNFTTEVKIWFKYSATKPARVEITGDDDIWVFLNGHLAIDLGNFHVPVDGSLAIDGGMLTSTANFEPPRMMVTSTKDAASYGLEDGHVYALAVFHAERQPYGSSFRLGLSGLDPLQGPCSPAAR